MDMYHSLFFVCQFFALSFLLLDIVKALENKNKADHVNQSGKGGEHGKGASRESERENRRTLETPIT